MVKGKVKAKKSVKNWRKEVLTYVMVFIAFGFVMDAWRTQDMPLDSMPAITGMTQNNVPVDVIAMSKQKPVVVYFWATWCAACKFVTPTINWLSDSYPVVGVSLNSGEDRRVLRYLNAKDYHFNNINDVQHDISSQWGISVTPTIAIIDNGEIKTITTGLTTPWGLLARLLLTQI